MESGFSVKKNKYNLKGDLNHNWERHLIKANETMKQDHQTVQSAVNVWFRTYSDNKYFTILPECIETICTEFFIEAKCGKCGQCGINEKDKELYLNLYDGFIGCSRYFPNKCSLEHWNEYVRKTTIKTRRKRHYAGGNNNFKVGNIKNMSLVACLSTICKDGADVWCYMRQSFVNYASDKNDRRELKNVQLEKLLNHWGIRMSEYKWRITD